LPRLPPWPVTTAAPAFPLGAAPVADTTYKVYGSADKTASNVTATYVSGTNSVRLSGLPAGPTVFYVAATEPGKNESVPVPVCVWTISEDGSTLNGIAPTAGSALAAQYDSSGRMRCCTVITAAANQAFSLPAAEGASKCSLFFVDANYCPTQPAMNCVLG
jgi:hypothetical protein